MGFRRLETSLLEALRTSLTLGFTSATSCVWEIMPFIFAVVSSPLPSHPVISITMLGVTFPHVPGAFAIFMQHAPSERACLNQRTCGNGRTDAAGGINDAWPYVDQSIDRTRIRTLAKLGHH